MRAAESFIPDFVCAWEKSQSLLRLACVYRTASRRKHTVKPNRRVRGSSDCGTPLTTSILSIPACATPKGLFISHFNANGSGKCSSSCFHPSQMWRLWGFGTRTTCTDQLNVLACNNTLWIESMATGHPPISCHSAQQSAPRVLDCLCSWAAAFGRWRLSPPATRARTPHETVWGQLLASVLAGCGWSLLTCPYLLCLFNPNPS